MFRTRNIYNSRQLPLFEEFMKKHTKISKGGKKYSHLHIVNTCQFIIISINKYSFFLNLFSVSIYVTYRLVILVTIVYSHILYRNLIIYSNVLIKREKFVTLSRYVCQHSDNGCGYKYFTLFTVFRYNK